MQKMETEPPLPSEGGDTNQAAAAAVTDEEAAAAATDEEAAAAATVEEAEAAEKKEDLSKAGENRETSTMSKVAASAKDSTDDDDDDDDDDIDDDISSTESEDTDAGFSPSEDPNELLIKATTLKEEGNTFFKSGDFVKASRSYRRGTNCIKPLNKNNTGDDQVKALLVSLQTNLSMVCFKQDKAKMSRDVASSVLLIDKKNVKALYRRAVANRRLGNLEAARSDLREALKHDPSNNVVKKELIAIKKVIEDAKANQKKGLQKAFLSKSGALYGDKEEIKRKKEQEEKRRKQQEEEALKKRKAEWEDECVKRMANGKEAISFEDWEKERKERDDALKKLKEQEEQRKKAERKKKAREARRQEKAEESESDDELTEKELAMLRGYKKTSDGRVTSYFTREQSEHEKNLIGDITPQRLDQANAGVGPAPQIISPATSGEGSSQKVKGKPSAWNRAGTWEEKDTSDWCKDRLRMRLKETKATEASADFVAIVESVDDFTGEASVAMAGVKKQYIFDFHLKLKFKVRNADDDEVVASGKLELPDICSTHHEELEVNFAGWKKPPNKDLEESASKCRLALVDEIRKSVKTWVKDFNDMY